MLPILHDAYKFARCLHNCTVPTKLHGAYTELHGAYISWCLYIAHCLHIAQCLYIARCLHNSQRLQLQLQRKCRPRFWRMCTPHNSFNADHYLIILHDALRWHQNCVFTLLLCSHGSCLRCSPVFACSPAGSKEPLTASRGGGGFGVMFLGTNVV